MRAVIAIAAAAVLAGFTVQDAEKALDGEWAGDVSAIALSIDAKAGKAQLVEGGVSRSGTFKVEAAAGGAATFSIDGKRYIAHVREQGKTLMFSAEGQSLARSLTRVR